MDLSSAVTSLFFSARFCCAFYGVPLCDIVKINQRIASSVSTVFGVK